MYINNLNKNTTKENKRTVVIKNHKKLEMYCANRHSHQIQNNVNFSLNHSIVLRIGVEHEFIIQMKPHD